MDLNCFFITVLKPVLPNNYSVRKTEPSKRSNGLVSRMLIYGLVRIFRKFFYKLYKIISLYYKLS
jgi:hypothetical protein